jgi:predicted dehydrogenase
VLKQKQKLETVGIGMAGAGLFATTILLPVLRRLKGVRLHGVATATGLSGNHAGKKFGFEYCTTDYQQLLADPKIDLILILTRHGSHAQFVTEILQSGKHVYVEKPLAINPNQLQSVTEAYHATTEALQTSGNGVRPILFVGFNRRFSPFTRWIKERFHDIKNPLVVHCTVNAGVVTPDHWVHDSEQGGGRIIGEVCHFVDLIQFLTGSIPVRVYAETLATGTNKPSDNVAITLKMANGAVGTIMYTAGGDKSYPRERVEVFGGGAVGIIENFKRASFIRGGRCQRKHNLLSLDQGYRGEFEALLGAIRTGGGPPVSMEEYLYTTMATFAIEQSLQNGEPIKVEKV